MISNLCFCLITSFVTPAYSFLLKFPVNPIKTTSHVSPVFESTSDEISSQSFNELNLIDAEYQRPNMFHRRSVLANSAATLLSTIVASTVLESAANAKCTDIESCREVGERKVEEDLKLNPIVKLPSGTRYRVLRPPTVTSANSGGKVVTDGSSVDLAFSISSGSGQYMYSKGFGFEKIDFGGKQESDLGLDSIRAVIGRHDVPIGIEEALIGMGRGERRRVELPAGPNVGFESSNWQPAPTTRRGIVQIQQYKKKLSGFGSQPPFPAETVWDIEVLAIR